MFFEITLKESEQKRDGLRDVTQTLIDYVNDFFHALQTNQVSPEMRSLVAIQYCQAAFGATRLAAETQLYDHAMQSQKAHENVWKKVVFN
jgi:hypothetical protein